LIDRRQFIIGSSLLLSGLPALASERSPVTVNYGPANLDIYQTGLSSPRPVLFYVHGGAWQIGSRKKMGVKPAFFESLGYVLVSIDYRLFPFVKPAAQADDVASAYAWVRRNIAKFGGDPSRIVALGHSAGTHLLALTTLSGRMPGLKGLICNDIFMYDIPEFSELRGGHLPLDFSLVFNKASWKSLSPVTYLGQASVPPVLVAYSSLQYSKEMSLDFAARLKAAGVRVNTFDGSSYRHLQIDREIGVPDSRITDAVTRFLKATM
jgi:acetyl esterase/lipase